MSAITAHTKLAIIEHITSPTALIFPVQKIVAALQAKGIDTFVDGAHDPGQVPVNLNQIGAAYYGGNKLKHIKYEKSSGATAGKTIACKATFIFKQKVLNPENDVDGKIIMDVIVEAKEGKYRYTIKNITHKANKPGMDCGDVYGKIPACGSMKVNDLTWKHVKSAAFASAKVLTDDLKAVMKKNSDEEKDEW